MNEAELLETVTNYHGLAVSAMVFYLSIVTAYLVSAHFVGKQLDRFQVATITFLFVAFSFFATAGSIGYFWQASHYFRQTKAYQTLQIEELVSPHSLIGTAEVLGILASLWFMRQVRGERQGGADQD
ncbi:MAG: hypothetical protein NXI30_03710 [bacterium]|nr:hypothetical protein [bacterium]